MKNELKVAAALPETLSEGELARVRELAIEGGEVGGALLKENIARARVVVLLRDAGQIRGAVVLKRPRDSYRDKVSTWTGFPLPKAEFSYELGYVYIEPDLQGGGWSHRLVAEALSHSDGVALFATVRTDNDRMRKALAGAGFVAVGKPYEKTNPKREIGLLIRPATIAVGGARASGPGSGDRADQN